MSHYDTPDRAWDDVTDPAFFRITSGLFPHAFVVGASVLLATYDDETALVGAT